VIVNVRVAVLSFPNSDEK